MNLVDALPILFVVGTFVIIGSYLLVESLRARFNRE
jgi:hypothetical protein